MGLLSLVLLILAGPLVLALAFWLQRVSRRPAIAMGVIGVVVLFGGVGGFVLDPGWYTGFMPIQGIAYLCLYRWRRRAVLKERAEARLHLHAPHVGA